MSVSNDLMYALLAMDAYNRGYGEGIKHNKTQIGTASLTTDSTREFRDPEAPEGTITPD